MAQLLTAEEKPARSPIFLHIAVLAVALVVLYLCSLYSYLLFHSLTELFSIVVACAIFIIGWSTRRSINNGYLLLLGIAFFFIAVIDTLHTLAYKGMPVFPGYGSNLPTQLWIAGRYLQSIALLIAPLYLRRKLQPLRAVAGLGLVTVLMIAAIFSGIFPTSYIEGIGLTPFKILSEYIISALLLGAIGLLVISRRRFDSSVLHWLLIGIAASVVSELAFTDYVSVFSNANLIGHLLKIVAFYCFFQAIVETGFYRPFSLLLRDLKLSEATLRADRTNLEIRVEERTQELAKANAELRCEIEERRRIEVELSEVQSRLMDSKEAERLSLARELHDGPIQDLLAAMFQIREVRLDLDDRPQEQKKLESIQKMISGVNGRLRTICGELRPQTLAPFGLEKAIRSHADYFRQEHPGIKLNLDLLADGQEFPEQIRMTLYRIYQQTLANVVQHAHASQVCASFIFDDEKIILEVSDDGQGFRVPEGWIHFVRDGHLGLAGIAERAESVGGKLTVSSRPGGGTRVMVIVPRSKNWTA